MRTHEEIIRHVASVDHETVALADSYIPSRARCEQLLRRHIDKTQDGELAEAFGQLGTTEAVDVYLGQRTRLREDTDDRAVQVAYGMPYEELSRALEEAKRVQVEDDTVWSRAVVAAMEGRIRAVEYFSKRG